MRELEHQGYFIGEDGYIGALTPVMSYMEELGMLKNELNCHLMPFDIIIMKSYWTPPTQTLIALS